jgi:Ca-activated chloride channel family protein
VSESDDDTNSFVAKLWATRRVGEIIDELDLKGHNDELVKELVDLATKHGILTPYTSFLAEEESLRRDPSRRVESAGVELRALQEVEGEFAFRQRAAKGSYQHAERAAAPAPAGYGGGFGGAAPAADADSISNLSATGGRGVRYYDAKTDKLAVAGDLIAVGRKTLARHGDRWVDTTVTEEEEKSAQAIERYTREYFDLVSRHGKHVAQYLAIEDPVVIKLDGKVYAW